MNIGLRLAVVIGLFVGGDAIAQEPTDPLAKAEKTLREAKLPTDGEGLLEFFRSRTLTTAQRAALVDAIHRLGDDSFDVREAASEELIAAGSIAVPLLRDALHHDYPEVVRRAELCLERIRQGITAEQIKAAAMVLVDRRPPGCTEVLFTFVSGLPDDDPAHEPVVSSLVELMRTHRPAADDLLDKVNDDDARVRGLVARILGEASADYHPRLRGLLADADPTVRYRTAAALIRGGDRDAVPTLITLLGEGPTENAFLAEDMLCRLLDGESPPATLGRADPPSRARCVEAWQSWWRENGKNVDLSVLTKSPALKGLTLIVEVDNNQGFNSSSGRIWECGPDGKQRWQITGVGGPVDVQVLPGGRLLVAEYYAKRVTERDRAGKILWESEKLPSNPVSCQRLPDGNTLVATMNSVVLITPDRKIETTYPKPKGTVFQARRARNGHVFILGSGGELIELDTTGKQLRSLNVGSSSGWGGFQLLPNGHFLIAKYTSGNEVIEIDSEGKTVWTLKAPTPTRAQRLPNGNTLVAGGNTRSVAEYTREGKKVWETETDGRPFSVLRY